MYRNNPHFETDGETVLRNLQSHGNGRHIFGTFGFYRGQNSVYHKTRKSLQAKGVQPSFVYLAVNMYWEELSLALPKLPPHYMWKVFMDTEKEEGFLDRPVCPSDRHKVSVAPRSIKILRAVPDMDSIARERNAERLEKLPPAGAVLRDLRRSRDPEAACGRHSAWPKTPARVLRRMKKMIRPSTAHRSM